MKHSTTFELNHQTLVIAVTLLCFSSVNSERTSTMSLSVKIEDSVSIQSCSKILSNLELLLSQTSSRLHSLTEGSLMIDHFNIELPESWAKSATCVQTRTVATSSHQKSSDITVLDKSQNNLPWALQYGQCGVKGSQLFVPSSRLSEPNFSKSEIFLDATFEEFSKFNFGIFLDNQTQLQQQSICNLMSCTAINSSFYDMDLPSRQNLLCNGQSPLEVILSTCRHNSTSGCEPKPYQPPSFTFSTSADSLIILVIDRMVNNEDVTTSKASPINWQIIQNAFFLFIAKLPAGSALSIITYGTEATLNLSPTLITKTNAAELFAKIPRRHLNSQQKFVESCSKCGLKMALKVSNSSLSRLNPSIVLLSKTPFYPTPQEFGPMPPVYSIGLTASLTQSLIVKNENIKSFVLPECSENGECLFALSQILSSISTHKKRVSSSFYRRSIETDGSSSVSGRFEVSENLRENIWIVLTSNDEKDVEFFELTDPTGRRYQFPKYEHGLSYFALDGQRAAGEWSYNVKLYDTSLQKLQLDVAAQGSARNDVTTLKGWTQVDTKDSSKVFIYAQVMQKSVPIKDEVEVRAVVHRPSMEPVHIPLRDLGTGYPDLKTEDGIYSAYFTKFSPEPGHYHVEIIASSKIFDRFIVADSFYAEQATGFYIREGSSVPVNDVFPPSRVTDLNVESYLEDSLFVSMSWSAPGGDYDSGKALRYEIRCSTNRESLHNDRYAEASILVDASLVPSPAEYGERQDCTVGVPWTGQMFYYAIVGLDEAGNKAEISNVVAVKIDKREEPAVTLLPFGEETSTPEMSRNLPQEGERHNATDYSVIAYVICSLLLVLSFVSFAVWRIVRHCKHTSKEDPENGEGSDKSDDSQCNPNNITTEDIWSLTSSSNEKSSAKSSLHYVPETQANLQSQFLYNDLHLLKDVDLLSSLVLQPRDSVLEDMSVYRDLSNLDSQSLDYFALSHRLSVLLYCDEDTKRKESLV